MVTPLTLFAELFPFLISGIDIVSITLIRFEIISRNLVQIKYDQTLIVNCYSFYGFFLVLCHFVILYMVSIEIVSFCRIISL